MHYTLNDRERFMISHALKMAKAGAENDLVALKDAGDMLLIDPAVVPACAKSFAEYVELASALNQKILIAESIELAGIELRGDLAAGAEIQTGSTNDMGVPIQMDPNLKCRTCGGVAKVEICLVCDGRGLIRAAHSFREHDRIVCHQCDGRGDIAPARPTAA